MKDRVAITTRGRVMAVYKGLTVAVYTVDKTEISLSRSDLIELINVCILFSLLILFSHLFVKSISRQQRLKHYQKNSRPTLNLWRVLDIAYDYYLIIYCTVNPIVQQQIKVQTVFYSIA